MNGEEKIEKCKFRSFNEIVHIVKRCSCRGGNYEKRGYFCNKKQVFDIKAQDCQICDLFEAK